MLIPKCKMGKYLRGMWKKAISENKTKEKYSETKTSLLLVSKVPMGCLLYMALC